MIEGLKKLAEAAPIGPWEYDPNADSYSGSISNKSGFLIEGEFYGGSSVATYITAASPDAVLKLIAERDALYEALKDLLADIENYQAINLLNGYNNIPQINARAALALVGEIK